MPVWLQATLAILTLTFGSIAGGALLWVKFFRSEVPLSDAQIREIEANVKVKEAQVADVIGTALGNALNQVKELAEERRVENVELRTDLSSAEKRIDGLEDDVAALKHTASFVQHYYGPRGEHGEWDKDAHRAALSTDPDFREWPPFPSNEEGTP